MMSRLLLKTLFVGTLFFPVCGSNAPATAGEPPANVREARPGAEATSTYTVWYRRGNQRWRGIRGLSYYHATRVRDQYIRAGYRAYIERN